MARKNYALSKQLSVIDTYRHTAATRHDSGMEGDDNIFGLKPVRGGVVGFDA